MQAIDAKITKLNYLKYFIQKKKPQYEGFIYYQKLNELRIFLISIKSKWIPLIKI